MATSELLQSEHLDLAHGPARYIEVKSPAGIQYTLQFWDYTDVHGVRVRIHFPGTDPPPGILLESYSVDLAAPGPIVDPTMMPQQNDEPIKIDGTPIGGVVDGQVMASFFNEPGHAHPPPGDAKALVICRHDPCHMLETRHLCLQEYASLPAPNATWFKITPE